jgi:uncharacterized protein with von Willebrand factor type A (vWA) domain
MLQEIPTRRFRPDRRGRRYDLRRSMQLMLRTNGQLVEVARKTRRCRPPALVLIADISGSMSGLLADVSALCTCAELETARVHSFVFGTRLTNIHALAGGAGRRPGPWRTLRRRFVTGMAVRALPIGLERFNMDWGRRVLSGRAVVIVLSDGLEKDSRARLEVQMQRLRRTADRLIWLNPLLLFDDFEPLASGSRPCCRTWTGFLPAHNINSLVDLGGVLSTGPSTARRHAA